jgi:TPR repeat protein
VIAILLPGLPPLTAGRPNDEAPQLISTTGGKGEARSRTLPELQKLAATGNPDACLQLGLRYETGDGVAQDYVQARTEYEQAAAGGVALAIYRLGRFYQNGYGVASDAAMASELYRLAALADVPLAQYNLGAMLVSARGVKRDFVEGLAWLILASRNQIEAEGEQRTRARLAGQPQIIAAAEKRAAELRKEIDARRGNKPSWPPPEISSVSPTPEKSAPAVDKPRIEAPQIERPKIELAPPPVPVPEPPSPANP